MPLQSSLEGPGKGLCLLSLDAGGPRGTSQIKILVELMHRLNFEAEDDKMELPCTAFDMIGGSGTGGFIAILLVIFGMTAEQALEEFIALSVSVFDLEVDAEVRTTALKKYVDDLLAKYGIGYDMRLMDSNHRSKGCKLVVPISYKQDVENSCNLCNFDVEQEQPLNLTIADALLATLAAPPLFIPITVLKDAAIFEYISADLTLGNPIQQLLAEAHGAFGARREVACIISLGCGHSGIISPPNNSDATTWGQFVERVVTGSDETARGLDSLIGHLGFYHRFSVTRGLDRTSPSTSSWHGDAISHTADYLGDPSVSRKVDMSVNSLKMTDGVVSLEDLKHPGGHRVLPASLPALTRTFIMRKEPWKFIKKAMLEERGPEEAGTPRMLAVTGMGGCGKTQLVLKFMQVHTSRFVSLFFIDGSSEQRIRADVIRHVRSLGLEYSQMDFDDCLRILALSSPRGPRLLLYDNVDDPELELGPLLPLGIGCAIIITSRNRSVGKLCQDAHLELDIMSIEEAVDLLLYTPVNSTQIPNITYEDADAIARELGYLPIALTQARSYMYETKCSGSEYMKALIESKGKLLAEPVTAQRDMRYSSTYAAFDASFQILSLWAQQLVRLLSCFHWRNFPLELIMIAAKYEFFRYEYKYAEVEYGNEFHTGKEILIGIFLRGGKWARTDLEEMIISLQNHSFIKLIPGVGTRLVQMHPLAHEWIRSQINEPERVGYQSASVLLLALGARVKSEDRTSAAQYLPSHVTHMSPLWDQLHVNDVQAFAHILKDGGFFQDALRLQDRVVAVLREKVNPQGIDLSNALWSVALIYQELGRSKEAEELQVDVLRLRKQVLGELHPGTITASNNLALTYHGLGRLKEAEELQVAVLRLRKQVLGELHPDTFAASSNLANTYYGSGRLKEAEELQVAVLRLRKEVLGELHPDTIAASSNLANTYYGLGRLKEAEELEANVLRLRKQVLGELHPDTLAASNNLANTYHGLGRLSEAEELQVDVRRLRKQVLGELHPDTIAASGNLASTYYGLGRLKEAEELDVDVLRLRKQVLGDFHPDTITASNNLASTYYGLGRLKEAEELQVDVRRLRKQVLGELHPDTIAASNNLANTYYELGRLKEAEELQVDVLRLSKQALGELHPNTIAASNNLASTYYGSGRLKEAEELQVAVLRLRKEVLGELHPDTIAASSNLANTYYGLGRLKEAEELEANVLRLRKQVLGDFHPDTITASNNLASTYYGLGRLKEAEELQVDVLRLRKQVLGELHPDTISASNNLALTYYTSGRFKQAEELQVDVLKLRKQVLGELHPDTITASSNLASTYYELGRLNEAEELQVEVLSRRKQVLGELHPDTIKASNNLALTYFALGRLKEAEELQLDVLRLRKQVLGELHPDTIKASNNLAVTYHGLGRLKEAEELQVDVLRLRKQVLGELHPDTIEASNNLAVTYHELGRLKEAEELQVDVWRLMKQVLGEHHPDTITASNNLASTYHGLGRLKEAEELQLDVLRLRKQALGEPHPDTISTSNNLALTYYKSGRSKQAEVIQVEVLKFETEVFGAAHPRTTEAMINLANTYASLSRNSDSLSMISAAQIIVEEKLGTGHWQYELCQNIRHRIQSLRRGDQPTKRKREIDNGDTTSGDVELMEPSSKRQHTGFPVAVRCNSQDGGNSRDWRTIVGICTTRAPGYVSQD